MKKWMSGQRGFVFMVLLWIVGWALGFGGLLEIYDSQGRIQDVWPTVMAVPGFIGGIIFSGLLLATEKHRSFDEVPVARFAACGILTGIVLGLLTIAAEVGDASPGALGMTGIMTALSLVAAIGSALFFRLVGKRHASKVTA